LLSAAIVLRYPANSGIMKRSAASPVACRA
jgi:hypothetical protein